MGMNRKWNMKVFELHTPQHNDVVIDTTKQRIVMRKYPFEIEDVIGEDDIASSNVVRLNMSDLTEFDMYDYITNKSNWKFKQGSANNIDIQTSGNDTIFTFDSIVKAFLDLPIEDERWVLKFYLKTNSSSYRNFFGFDGVEDTELDIKYAYGMDIPDTGYPHLETKGEDETEPHTVVTQTIAEEQYFTGQDYMPVVLTRWNDVYTLYYDNTYMITIPTSESINRIGFWIWSNSNVTIKNPQLYTINDDSITATNIIIDINEDYSLAFGSNSYTTDTQGNITVTTTLTDNNNNAISGRTITLSAGTNTTTATTDSNGVATFNLTGITDDCILSASYYYANATASCTTRYVNKLNTNITITTLPSMTNTGRTLEFTGYLKDENNTPVKRAMVYLTNDNSSTTTGTDGSFRFSYFFSKSGNITLTVSYDGDDNYNSCTNSAEVSVI